jgi:hypothetical protein
MWMDNGVLNESDVRGLFTDWADEWQQGTRELIEGMDMGQLGTALTGLIAEIENGALEDVDFSSLDGALDAALTAIDLKKYKRMSMICYLAMGWAIVAILRPTVTVMTTAGFLWLLAGGICYTVGAVLYGLGKKHRYMHSIFHLFVNFGSILQAVAILRYVL